MKQQCRYKEVLGFPAMKISSTYTLYGEAPGPTDN